MVALNHGPKSAKAAHAAPGETASCLISFPPLCADDTVAARLDGRNDYPQRPENDNLPNGRYAEGRRSGVLPLARLQRIRLVPKGFAPRIHCPCHLNRNGLIRGHCDVRAGFATEDPETG